MGVAMVPNRVVLGVVDMEVTDRRKFFYTKPKPAITRPETPARHGGATKASIDRMGPLGPQSLTVFHAAIVMYYMYVDYEMFTCSRRLRGTDHPVTRMFLKGTTQFFTDWTQVIHQTYFFASLVQDILTLRGNHQRTCQLLSNWRHRLFGPVLLPATCLTVANFWLCYAVAPNLMLGDLVPLYPKSMNHAMHTLIVPIAYAELFTTQHKVVPRTQGLRSVTILMSGYASWMYIVSYLTDLWPYRFLVVMGVRQHLIFIPCMHAWGYMWFFLNEAFIKLVWGYNNGSNNNNNNNDMNKQDPQ